MSGTPPFCALGQKYTIRDFKSQPSGFNAPSKTGNSINTFSIDGWLTSFNGNFATGGGYTINRTTAQQIALSNTNWTLGSKFKNWQTGCGFVIKNSIGSSIIIQSYSAGQKGIDVSNPITSTTFSNTSDDFLFEVRRIGTTIYADIDGVTIASGLAADYGGWNTHDFPISIYWGSQVSSTANYIVNGALLEYVYWIGNDGDNFCQGEIPTYHKEIDSSTAKISHSRMLIEDRNSAQAEIFHNQIKATT